MGSVPIPPNPRLSLGEQVNSDPLISAANPVTSGIVATVPSLNRTASTPIVATNEDVGGLIEGASVPKAVPRLDNQRIAQGQRFRRHLVWGREKAVLSRTALWTETAAPLPRPPPEEFGNQEATETIVNNPDLFKIISPIDVDHFQSLLVNHPNQPFVDSVCVGLREGFWPFAHTHPGEWPSTWDNSFRVLKSEDELSFVREQVLKEVHKGRFSHEFGPDLLPGMYSMPVHVVPKPGVKKFRLVTDHSAGEFALNNMISREDVAGVTLDNVYDLGQALRSFRVANPSQRLVVWKGDVSEAYRLMPMHPLWQIKQVVTVSGHRYIDRCNVFGGRASQRIWHAFMSLVLWIAVFERFISNAYLYVDDSFGFDLATSLRSYSPYAKLLPSALVSILTLWDELRIPHEEKKQLFAPVLPVIGFDVDPNLMTVRMSPESQDKLLDAISQFAHRGARCPLRDFQRLAGYLNWALNVYPMLRPGLSALYAKTAGKQRQHALLWINRDVVRELHWFAHHVRGSSGVHVLSSVAWTFDNLPPSTFLAYTDASEVGLGFWFPSLDSGYAASMSPSHSPPTIFFLEALAVLAAIQKAASLLPHGARIAIFTDNSNTVGMFNTLAALPKLNWLLLSAVDVLLAHDLDFRVFHIPGHRNVVADHLSRGRFAEAVASAPGLRVHSFEPPRDALGAASA